MKTRAQTCITCVKLIARLSFSTKQPSPNDISEQPCSFQWLDNELDFPTGVYVGYGCHLVLVPTYGWCHGFRGRKAEVAVDMQLVSRWMNMCDSTHGSRCRSSAGKELPLAADIFLIDLERDCYSSAQLCLGQSEVTANHMCDSTITSDAWRYQQGRNYTYDYSRCHATHKAARHTIPVGGRPLHSPGRRRTFQRVPTEHDGCYLQLRNSHNHRGRGQRRERRAEWLHWQPT